MSYRYGQDPKNRYGRGTASRASSSEAYDLIPNYAYPYAPSQSSVGSGSSQPLIKKSVGSDNIYFNIEITNPNVILVPPQQQQPPIIPPFQNSVNFIRMEYRETLTQTLIENPSEYYLTVARFVVPGLSIPLIDMDILPNQPDANLTPYVVCLSFGGFNAPVNLEYISTVVTNAPVAPSLNPPTFQKVESEYYYIFEYSVMIQMMNIALATSFANLQGLVALPPGVTQPPFFIFDPVTDLISLVAQASYSQVINGGPTVQIFSNVLLYNRFLNSMSVQFFGDNQPNGKDFLYLFPPMPITYPTRGATTFVANLLPVYNNSYATLQNPAPPGNYLMASPNYYTNDINFPPITGYLYNTQQFVTLEYWNSFKNIVFTSAALPIQAEYIPATGSVGANPTGAAAYRPILTDYQVNAPRAGDDRSILYYTPTGPYRLLDLLGTTPITKIDLQIWWQDIFDILHPLYLAPYETASVKLLFIKKYPQQ